jgi:hypothetical protein
MKNLDNLPLRWVYRKNEWPTAYYKDGSIAAKITCDSQVYNYRTSSVARIQHGLKVVIIDYSMGGVSKRSVEVFTRLADAKLFVNQLINLYPDLRSKYIRNTHTLPLKMPIVVHTNDR